MNKTATEVVFELLHEGIQKEAGILTSPIRKFFRNRTSAGKILNEALALRAGRPKVNKEIARTLRSRGNDGLGIGGNDIAKSFNTAKPGNKATVLRDAAYQRGEELLAKDYGDVTGDSLYKDLWDLYNKYVSNRQNIKHLLRRSNEHLSWDLK